jgi:tetratricopeptide (TPR) repeat protein
MNSGLPSLLDAIFGKQDLALVSLDEIYEVIREFPSFNAGHFLLAKKLRLQDDPGYEMESMRTALYFNNPFWLQSLLDDGNHFQPTESLSHVKETRGEDPFIFEEYREETLDISQEEGNYTFESYTPIEKPATKRDELDEETEEILEEKLNSDPVRSEETFQYAEPGSQKVTSFDELMAKYNLQPLDMVDETAEAPEAALPVDRLDKTAEAPDAPLATDMVNETVGVPEASLATDMVNETVETPEAVLPAKEDAKSEQIAGSAADNDQDETLEEVVNEYGIFEEIVKKPDHDLDAFDTPLDQIPFVSDKIIDEAPSPGQSVITAHASSDAENSLVSEDVVNPLDGITAEDTKITENASDSGDQESEDAPHQTDEHDYDSFDRPLEEPEHIEASMEEYENSNKLTDYDPDNTEEPVEYSDDSEAGANGQMQELSERLGEHQKSLTAFNAKNADSIVFTPYHMVDYFASQGIKLILEDNPPDHFGKQLKSFTDWLKVMKKLPPQPVSEKENEKENEQIRHFAAHSIEERDILTESMAEVLAKQGMYENAIALFQKLSLIYPPKSAYFASRIEQIKASLP